MQVIIRKYAHDTPETYLSEDGRVWELSGARSGITSAALETVSPEGYSLWTTSYGEDLDGKVVYWSRAGVLVFRGKATADQKSAVLQVRRENGRKAYAAYVARTAD